MENIKKWLASEQKDYFEGVSLLSKVTKNRVLVNFLMKRESPSNLARLTYQLSKHSEESTVQAENITPDNPNLTDEPVQTWHIGKYHKKDEATGLWVVYERESPPEAINPTKTDATTEPLSELDLHIKKMQEVYFEKAEWSNKLADQKDDQSRKKVVDKVLELDEKYNQMAEARDVYKSTRQWPKAPEKPLSLTDKIASMGQAELLQSRTNLRTYKTKAERDLKADPDNVKKQEKLAKIKAELDIVETSLNLKKAQTV
jgi:hypothetical protein